MIKNLEGIKKHQNRVREESTKSVKDSIKDLLAQNRQINFKTVSEASGISRKTLYKVKEFAQLVKEYRGDFIENNDATDSVLQLEQEIKDLKDLNSKLLQDLNKYKTMKQDLIGLLNIIKS